MKLERKKYLSPFQEEKGKSGNKSVTATKAQPLQSFKSSLIQASDINHDTRQGLALEKRSQGQNVSIALKTTQTIDEEIDGFSKKNIQ